MKETWIKNEQKFLFYFQPWTKYLAKSKEWNETLDKIKKLWYLLLLNFWPLFPKTCLCTRDWVLSCVPTQLWDILDISSFSKILSPNSCGNSRGNSETKFVALDIKSRFAGGGGGGGGGMVVVVVLPSGSNCQIIWETDEFKWQRLGGAATHARSS